MQDGAQVTGEQLGKLRYVPHSYTLNAVSPEKKGGANTKYSFRDLIQQASEAEQSNPLDTNALNTKLQYVVPIACGFSLLIWSIRSAR